MPIRLSDMDRGSPLRFNALQPQIVYQPVTNFAGIASLQLISDWQAGAALFDGPYSSKGSGNTASTNFQPTELPWACRLLGTWSAGGSATVATVFGRNHLDEAITWDINKLTGGLIARSPNVFKKITKVEIISAENPAVNLELGVEIISGTGNTILPIPWIPRGTEFTGGLLTDDVAGVYCLSLGGATVVGGATENAYVPGTFSPNAVQRTITISIGNITGAATAEMEFLIVPRINTSFTV